MCEGQYQGNVEIKGDFRVGKAPSSEVVMAKEVVQLASIFDRVDHGALSVHLLQILNHILIDTGPLEKPVEEPPQKETRLMIQHIRI